MHDRLKTFLRLNKKLIEFGKWDEVFRLLNAEFRGYIVGENIQTEFCRMVENSGIDLLNKLSFVPANYMSSVQDLDRDVELPTNIKSINEYAFTNCKINSLYIPSTVTYIGTNAFKYSTINHIYVDDFNDYQNIKFETKFSKPVDYQTFLNIKNHEPEILNIPKSVHNFPAINNFTTYLYTGGLTHIYRDQFVLPILETLYFSDLIQEIDYEAFCYSLNVKEIIYEGTIEDWSKVSMKPNSFRNVPVKIIKCSNGVTKLRH